MIPMVDLRTQYHSLKADIDKAVLDALDATQFILGPNVRQLEEEVSQSLAVPHVVSCASGTDALHLALAALGIGPGDEVITTPFTFIATAEAIAYVGATPVFVDIDAKTFNLDLAQVRGAVTPKTKAVIAVHLFGQPADVHGLMEACCKDNLYLIEDCAQSFGATVGGKPTGGFGVMGCFSFFPSKNLGGYGDGGTVTTLTDAHKQELLALRNHGSHVRYYHDVIGYNSRLDELQAAILRVKLKHIERFNTERRRVAHRYNEKLQGLAVTTPFEDGIGRHVFHQYTILTDHREKISAFLTDKKIASAVYYPVPLHRQKAFGDRFSGLSLPVAESVSQRCLSLPIYPEMTNDQVDEVAAAVRDALRS